ncbi:polyisoprenoid-binding protein [Luteimonas sp. SJ-92]|uniref:Polyisoprenoid-binding protein n=1 Tax=Luteimonas salinisoli TaxID=2752307 RepID=A0A853JIU2_9GAMM|nr:YceI family protein [Luteimonas salinisoli]NZA28310.1 polyisoprenoid-binding protein [Luteimonas salinisoli]
MRNALLLAALLALAGPATATDYVQAPGSSLAFGGTYQGEAFSGRFPGFRTTLSFDPTDPAGGRLDVTIPLASATTGNDDYDGELRGRTFFDSARFAQARYTATGFRALDDGRYAADGVLSLRGIERPVTLVFSWTPGPEPVLAGRATVSRLEFGVGEGEWSDTSVIPDAIAVSTRVVLRPAD